MSWWNLLPAAASLAGTLLSRPKKKDYIYDTGYMDRYINSLRGQRLDSQISHMIMQPALRAIGHEGARFGRTVDYYTARRKPGGGIEAQMRLSGSQKRLEAIQIAGEKAFSAQYRENRRIGDLIGRIEMEKGRYGAYGKREYARARTQWGREVVSGGLSLAATAGASIAATRKANTAILDKAKSLDLIDDATTLKEFKQMGANQGFENMPMFVNQLARDRGIEQALNVYDPSNIPSNENIDEAVRAGEITAQYGRELKLKTHELQGEIEKFKSFNVMDTDLITEEDVISQVEEGRITPKQGQEHIDTIRAKAEMDEYVRGFASLKMEIEVSRDTEPENMEYRMNMIENADLPPEQKMAEMEKEVTFSSKLLSSFRKKIYAEFFDPKSTPSNLLDLQDEKGTTKEEGDLIARLAKTKTDAINKAKGGGLKQEKIAEGVMIANMARNRLMLAQRKHRDDPNIKFIAGLLNVRNYGDLEKLGKNKDAIQAYLAEVAEFAEIPTTLPGFIDIFDPTETEIEEWKDYNAKERVKYVKQKWQDDIMESIYKALKAANFPGVQSPLYEIDVREPKWRGVPYPSDILDEGGIGLSKYQTPLPVDLSIWEK